LTYRSSWKQKENMFRHACVSVFACRFDPQFITVFGWFFYKVLYFWGVLKKFPLLIFLDHTKVPRTIHPWRRFATLLLYNPKQGTLCIWDFYMVFTGFSVFFESFMRIFFMASISHVAESSNHLSARWDYHKKTIKKPR
jgi:hypothetical protein